MRNVSYSGIRAFIKGLLEHSQSGTIAKWVDNRMITSVYVNSSFTIGGEEKFIERGAELLLALHQAAKDKKLTEAEGKAIADYLVHINWKLDTLRSMFYLEVLDDKDIQKDLTSASKQDTIQSSESGSVVEPELATDEQPVKTAQNTNEQKVPAKKAGRPPAKKS